MDQIEGEDRKGEVRYHTSVLLDSVIDFLRPARADLFIDATAGGGGHTEALLAKGARVLAIDRDPEATSYLNKKFKTQGDLILARSNFANIAKIAISFGFDHVKGIIFDLGVSGNQLDSASRGFSFRLSGPLDMRMDPDIKIMAEDIINNFDQRRLNEIFKTYGQEKFSWSIARSICRARQVKPIETTGELAQIIEKVVPKRKRGIHPATKSFQALRIVINSELLNLEQALPQTLDLLKPGGRLAIISFHSLEDGIVKRFFKQESRLLVLTKKPIGPTFFEIQANPRARSAKLRVAERI